MAIISSLAGDRLAFAILLPAVFKLIEMWGSSILWTVRNGNKLCDRFHEALSTQGLQRAREVMSESGYDPWRFTRAAMDPFWRPFRPIIPLLTNWHLLTLLSAVVVYEARSLYACWIALTVTVCLLFTKVVHRVVTRFMLGVADNVRFSLWRASGSLLHMSRIARRVAFELVSDVATIGIAFGFLFASVDRYDPRFFHPAVEELSVVQAIYFSFVTVTTTGYGDVVPLEKFSTWLVLGEMALVWTLVVVIIFHYSVTLSALDDQGGNSRSARRRKLANGDDEPNT